MQYYYFIEEEIEDQILNFPSHSTGRIKWLSQDTNLGLHDSRSHTPSQHKLNFIHALLFDLLRNS